MRPEVNEELVNRVIEKWKVENRIAIEVPKSKIIEDILLRYLETTPKMKISSGKRGKLLRKFIQVGRIIKRPKNYTNSIRINSIEFGSITINNKKYNNDVILSYSDLIKEGKPQIRHLISKRELNLFLEERPDVIIIGTGQEGCLQISPEVFNITEQKGIEILSSTTPEAIKKFNQLYASGRRVVGYMHVTC